MGDRAVGRAATVRAVRDELLRAAAEARGDFHHKLSTTLIRDNHAVYVEDLAVSGLARPRLAKPVHDAGWSAFVGMQRPKDARSPQDMRRPGTAVGRR